MWVPVFRQWGWITDLMKGSLSWWGCQLSLKDHPLSAHCALIFSERGTDWVDFISRMEDPVEESFPPLQKADLPHSRSNHTGLLLAQVSIQVQLWGINIARLVHLLYTGMSAATLYRKTIYPPERVVNIAGTPCFQNEHRPLETATSWGVVCLSYMYFNCIWKHF